MDTPLIKRLLAIAALICAVIAWALPGPTFLDVAVVLLALAVVL